MVMVENWCVSGCGDIRQRDVHRSAEIVRGGSACQNDEQGAQKL